MRFNGISTGLSWDFDGIYKCWRDFRWVDISENQPKDGFMAWYTMIYPNHICRAISYNWLADWEAPPTSNFTPETLCWGKHLPAKAHDRISQDREDLVQGGAPIRTGRIFCLWCTYVRSLLIRLHGVTHLFANCPWIVCRFPSLSHYQLVSSQLSIVQLWSTNNF